MLLSFFNRHVTLFFLCLLLCQRENQLVFFVGGTVERCQANCASPDRLSGPTRYIDPLGRQKHPYALTDFPTSNHAFCMLGCSYFFGPYDFNDQSVSIVNRSSVDIPTNESCVQKCQMAYRYQVTTGFSDVIEESLSSCYDGCDIALQTCQAGFYCIGGWMLPCPPGYWRNESVGVPAVLKCNLCPFGRYRYLSKGKHPDECSLCPRGKYADFEGATQTSECIRCQAGKFADDEGMRVCKCITPDSCELNFRNPDDTIKEQFYIDQDGYSTDYFRESVPYIGRW